MVIKGILESITTSNVNLVNADLLAKMRGLRIIESTVPSTGKVRHSLSLKSPPLWPPEIQVASFLTVDYRQAGAFKKAL